MQQDWKRLGTYGTVGLEFAAAVLLGLYAGKWLDEKAGTAPWIMALGLVLGAAAGFRNLWRVAQRAEREIEAQDRAERGARRKYHERDSRPDSK